MHLIDEIDIEWLKDARALAEKPFIREQRDPPDAPGAWAALIKLLERSYWRRGWIIQELAGSATALFICGSMCTRFASLALLLFTFNEKDQAFLSAQPAMTIVQEAAASGYLLDLLFHSRFAETSDPRDKVYSLLELARPYKDAKLPIDYSISWQETFRRTAIHVMQESLSLNILICGSLATEGLPSWAPNWNDGVMDWIFRNKSGVFLDVFSDVFSDVRRCLIKGKLTTRLGQFSAGGPIDSIDHWLFHHGLLTAHAIHIMTIDDVLPGEDTLVESDAVAAELKKRLDFLGIDYSLEEEIPYNTLMATFTFLWCHLLQAVRGTTELRGELPDLQLHWLYLCLSCLFEQEDAIESSEEILIEFITTGLFKHRSLFKCSRPSELFSVEDILQKWIALLADLYQSLDIEYAADSALQVDISILPLSQTFGICRVQAKVGDIVSVIRGCDFPLLLRKDEVSQHYRIVGAAYVHGIMNGEVLGKLPETKITIF